MRVFARAMCIVAAGAIGQAFGRAEAVAQESAGVSLAVSQVSDASLLRTPNGAEVAVRGLLDVSVTVDLGVLAGLEGSTLRVQQLAWAGRNGSSLLGDVQGFSNIDAEPLARLGEVWLEQHAGERLRLRLGQLDVAAEFAATSGASDFLNSSFGMVPVLAGAPTYPAPATGLSVHLEAGRGLAVAAGTFSLAGSIAPEFTITELSARAHGARVAAGTWVGEGERGPSGGYALLDAALFCHESGGGLDLFAQLGYSRSAAPGVTRHAAIGLGARDLVSSYAPAQGVAASWVRFDQGQGTGSEYVLEAFGSLALMRAVRLQLDVQRIVRSGSAAGYGVTLRSVVEL